MTRPSTLVNIFRSRFVSDAEKKEIHKRLEPYFKRLDNALPANSTLDLLIKTLAAGHYSRQQIDLRLPTLIDKIVKKNPYVDYIAREIRAMRYLLTENESYVILKKFCYQNTNNLPSIYAMIDVWMLAEHLTDTKLQELFDCLGTVSDIINHFFRESKNLPIHHPHFLKTMANLISRMQNKENKKIIFDELVDGLVTRYGNEYVEVVVVPVPEVKYDQYKNSMEALTIFADQIISSEESDEIRALLFEKSLSLAKIGCGNAQVNFEAQAAFLSAMFAIPLKRGVLLENVNSTAHTPSMTMNKG